MCNQEVNDLRRQVKQLREELQQWKGYDYLTGLYNKDTFYEKARARILENSQRKQGIICLNIERFKVINDLYGTQEGDKLLRYLGGHLKKVSSDTDAIAARMTADIFVLHMWLNQGDVEEMDRCLQLWLSQYPLEMNIIGSLGVYEILDVNTPVNLMYDRAMLALCSVKGKFLKHVGVYREKMREDIIQEQYIINDAQQALDHKDFKIYYQPKCDITCGKIVGAEALVRWIHPHRGMISTGLFIPVFEKNGFIHKLDAYVWEEVCRAQRKWMDLGHKPLPVSVNVSRMDLYLNNLREVVLGLLKKYNLPAKVLELEITESAYFSNTSQLIYLMDTLRSDGFMISMDDFGSGYSSFCMLKDINVDVLKVDLHFLESYDDDQSKSIGILQAIVNMAHLIGLKVIMEGVETQKQVDLMQRIHCRYAQGYYYYKPMPEEEFFKLLTNPDLVDLTGMD